MNEQIFGNSIFQGFNNNHGIMICGYEWGHSKKDQSNPEAVTSINWETQCTFATKWLRYGDSAKSWPYDRRIRNWFSFWEHPLNEESLDSQFDQSIIRTNWAPTQNHKIKNRREFLETHNTEHFLKQIEFFKPRIIFFMGSSLIHMLRNEKVFPHFQKILGSEIAPLTIIRKNDFKGRKFKIYSNIFEQCHVFGFPHPSSSRGLSNEYIKLFQEDIAPILQNFKEQKNRP